MLRGIRSRTGKERNAAPLVLGRWVVWIVKAHAQLIRALEGVYFSEPILFIYFMSLKIYKT